MNETEINWPKLLALTIDDVMYWSKRFRMSCSYNKASSWLCGAAGLDKDHFERLLRGFEKVGAGTELESRMIIMTAVFTPIAVCRSCGMTESQIDWGADMSLGIKRKKAA